MRFKGERCTACHCAPHLPRAASWPSAPSPRHSLCLVQPALATVSPASLPTNLAYLSAIYTTVEPLHTFTFQPRTSVPSFPVLSALALSSRCPLHSSNCSAPLYLMNYPPTCTPTVLPTHLPNLISCVPTHPRGTHTVQHTHPSTSRASIASSFSSVKIPLAWLDRLAHLPSCLHTYPPTRTNRHTRLVSCCSLIAQSLAMRI